MKSLIRLLLRFMLFALVSAAVILVSIFSYLDARQYYDYNDHSWDNAIPYQVLSGGSYNISLDQHSHTTYSDGILTPRQSVLWHISMGYNAMFITDHNTVEHKDEVEELKAEFQDRILVMFGMEWTTDRIHLNFLGISDWDFDAFPIPNEPADQEIEAAIAEAHSQGAIVTVDHYIWGSYNDNKPTREQLRDWGADYFEIVNSDCNTNDYYDEESIAFCATNGLGEITGTDMHYPNFLQVTGNVHGWTLMSIPEFTEAALMTELQARNTAVLYSAAGAPSLGEYPMKPGYTLAKPFIEIGRYIRSVYIGDSIDLAVIGIIALYLFGLFAIMEVCRLGYIGLIRIFKIRPREMQS